MQQQRARRRTAVGWRGGQTVSSAAAGPDAPEQQEQQPVAPAPAPAAVPILDGGHHKSSPFTEALRKLGLPLSDRASGLLLLNVTVIFYASNWVVVKDEGATFDPFAFAFLRFAIAAAALSPFLKAALKDARLVRAGVEVGLWCSAGYLLQSMGLLVTDASRASFLATFTVIIVPILAGLSGRGVAPLTWASALGAFVGMACLEESGAPPSLNDTFCLLSACSFGVQVFRTEHWSRTLGSRMLLPLMSIVLSTTCAAALAATVATHPAAALEVATHPQLVLQAAVDGVLPIRGALYTGLISTALCLVVEVFALRDVSSTETAIIYSLEPVLGAAFSFVLLGERWGPLGWAGAGLILTSSLATQLFGSEAGEPLAESEAEE